MCFHCRRRYGQAGMELAAEIASRQVPWPDVPHPCGIIAGTRSFSWKSWISWLTTFFGILPGELSRGISSDADCTTYHVECIMTCHQQA